MFLNILMVIVSIAIIVLSLLQSGKSDGLVSALTGQSSGLFNETKERGSELFVTRLTAVLAVAFFVITILIHIG